MPPKRVVDLAAAAATSSPSTRRTSSSARNGGSSSSAAATFSAAAAAAVDDEQDLATVGRTAWTDGLAEGRLRDLDGDSDGVGADDSDDDDPWGRQHGGLLGLGLGGDDLGATPGLEEYAAAADDDGDNNEPVDEDVYAEFLGVPPSPSAEDREGSPRTPSRRGRGRGRGGAAGTPTSGSRTPTTSRRRAGAAVGTPIRRLLAGVLGEVVVDGDDGDDGDEAGPSTPSVARRRGRPRKGTPGGAAAASSPFASGSAATSVDGFLRGAGGGAGLVRPNAADAYFLAQARTKRRRKVGEPYPASRPRMQAGKEQEGQAMRACRGEYARWLEEMTAATGGGGDGWNVVLHGYGSKRRVLDEMAALVTGRDPIAVVVIVHGLFPGVTIKDVLQEVDAVQQGDVEVADKDGAAAALKTLDRLAHRIYARQSLEGAGRLWLFLHNLDAPGLRSERSLRILSLLALHPRIHLVCSTDHPNAPILFPTTAANARKHAVQPASEPPPLTRGFSWLWREVDTYAPYTLERQYARRAAAYAGKLVDDVSTGSGEITEEGTMRILASVPPMARRLFKLLASRQIEVVADGVRGNVHAANAPAFAIDSDILQGLARDRFIAREEERYNAQLQEYKDHGLVVEHAADVEGRPGRWLWVPLGRDVLQRVVATIQED